MEKNLYTGVRRFVLINMILVPCIPFLLALGNGVLQADRRSGGSLMETPREKIPMPLNDREIHTFIHRKGHEEPFLYAATWLKDQNWMLVIRQEKTEAEKALLSQQLIGASRLAGLGEMAAGFAHEINNPLQIISTELSLIRVLQSEMVESGELKPGDTYEQVTDSIDQVKLQIDRCSRITASILKFGRQSESRSEDLDLTAVIPEIIQMVQKKAEVHGIRMERRLPDISVEVTADASRLQQVLLNLLNNALEDIIEKATDVFHRRVNIEEKIRVARLRGLMKSPREMLRNA